MLRKLSASSVLLVMALTCGCGRGDAEVAVPHVDVVEQPQISQTEEQKEAELSLDTEAGTVLGEEEVTVMTPEGEPQTAFYTRVRGNGDFSVAYDASRFALSASGYELRFEADDSGEDSETPVFLSIRREDAPSAEELADQYVAESGEECTVEEITVGEGEYPALWVSYAEGTSADSRTCDLYLFRYNEKLYVAQIDCTEEEYEDLGGALHTVLSTLRFDEG